MTPSRIRAVALPRKSLPYSVDLTDRIYEVMKTSYEHQENIFYLSIKGQRRFGLTRWRVRPEKTALLSVIEGLPEFTSSQFREILGSIAGQKAANRIYDYLTELREDGVIERVTPGLFRRKTLAE
ncbi:MAG: hypothetical protein ACTSPB_19610 [Candidatus Thorarchaeota archaeon]